MPWIPIYVDEQAECSSNGSIRTQKLRSLFQTAHSVGKPYRPFKMCPTVTHACGMFLPARCRFLQVLDITTRSSKSFPRGKDGEESDRAQTQANPISELVIPASYG